jgi:hypothetical protein
MFTKLEDIFCLSIAVYHVALIWNHYGLGEYFYLTSDEISLIDSKGGSLRLRPQYSQ